MPQIISFRQKILLSFLSGLLLTFAVIVYMNSSYTLAIEEDLYTKLSFVRQHWGTSDIEKQNDFVFINTGKDPSLVDDTAGYGQVVVSDREKIYRFLKILNQKRIASLYTVVDLQFYYPFSANPLIDTLLAAELEKGPVIIAAIQVGGQVVRPIYRTDIGVAEYTTYNNNINKFNLFSNDSVSSVPVKLYEKLNKGRLRKFGPVVFDQDQVCLNTVWADYHLTSRNLSQKNYYNLGEILLDLEANPQGASFFKNKIILMGDMENDVHHTAIGDIPGSLILANIYLALVNHQHYLNYFWVFFLFLTFSLLSYYSWFKPLPKFQLKMEFLFSRNLEKTILKYCSYLGIMMLVTLASVFIFHMFVSLLFPSLLFTLISFFSQKKYNSYEA